MLNPDGESMTLLLARASEVIKLSETIITLTVKTFGHDALYSQDTLMVSTVHGAANKLLVAFMGKEAVDLRRATFQTKVDEQLVAYQVMDYPSEILVLMQGVSSQIRWSVSPTGPPSLLATILCSARPQDHGAIYVCYHVFCSVRRSVGEVWFVCGEGEFESHAPLTVRESVIPGCRAEDLCPLAHDLAIPVEVDALRQLDHRWQLA